MRNMPPISGTACKPPPLLEPTQLEQATKR
jgi:hypothetical protein